MPFRRTFRRRRFPFRRGNFRKRIFPKRRRYVRKPGLKRVINREISRRVENKCRQHAVTDMVLRGAGNTALLDGTIVPISPYAAFVEILQGIGQGARIGNRIRTKSLVIKGTIVPLPYDVTTNNVPRPVVVKLFFFYDKTDPTGVPSPATADDFFQFNNTTDGFSNDLVDVWRPINKDRYRLLTSRVFKLGNSSYEASAGALPQFQWYTNNDFKLNHNFRVSLTKHMIRDVYYQDNSTTPTTRGIYMLPLVMYADSLTMSADQLTCKMSYSIDYWFEDA